MNVRLLIVDDHVDGLGFLTLTLELSGFEVTAVTSVPAAKTAFSAVQPQLVISDLALPETDGYGLIQWLRSLSPECGGQVPTLALTAKAYDTDRQQALAAGFDAYLTKPVDVEALLETLTALLAAVPVRAEGSAATTVEP